MSWPDIPKIPGLNLPELSGFREKRDSIEESIEQYFSKAELSNISDYEKKRLQNMKKNYLMLLSLGLPVSKPDFMKGPRARKKAKKIIEDPDSDEEWTPNLERRKSKRTIKVPEPFVMPCFSDPTRVNLIDDRKQKRKRSSRSETAVKRRKVETTVPERTAYPKRIQTVTNYMDIEVPDDDTFIYCEECNKEYSGDCPEHGALGIVEDTPVSCSIKPCNKADQSLPSCLITKESQIPNAGQGVWAKEPISTRSRFGPYVGEIITDIDQAHSTGYSWQIYKDGKASHFVDATNPRESNWMRYVNCARTEAEQNLTAFQYRGQVYYRSHTPIEVGQELLVWYGLEYGKELGIRRGTLDQSGPTIVKSTATGGESYCCRQCPHVEFSTRVNYHRHMRNKHGAVIPVDILNQMRRLKQKPDPTNSSQFCEGSGEKRLCIGDMSSTSENQQIKIADRKCGSSSSSKLTCFKIDAKITNRGKDGKYGCSVCGWQAANQGNLDNHMRTHTGEKPFKCTVCEFRCGQGGDLKRHMRTHTGEKPFKCTVCEFRCTQQGPLKKHMRTHTGEKPFKCTVCEFRCTQQGHLKIHMRTHTGEKPFKCTVCEFRCALQVNLKSHMRIHTGEKPFKCTVCEFRCTHQVQLKRHMRTHTGEKPFKCTVCEFRCALQMNLKSHIRIHTGEKPFKCTVCEFRCTQQMSLKRHMRTHTGEKTFKCTVCEDLKEHMRTHTGEKPFKCTVCEFRCTKHIHLETHMRTHIGEKPFKCTVCEYRCSDPSSFRKHIKSHTRNSFECTVCHKNFPIQAELIRHQKIHLEE